MRMKLNYYLTEYDVGERANNGQKMKWKKDLEMEKQCEIKWVE